MLNTLQNKPGYSMSWAPAPHRRPAAIGQPQMVAPPTDFVESPLLALMTDTIAASSAAFLAWGLGARQNKWSTFWWVVSGITFVKGLHDLSRLGK